MYLFYTALYEGYPGFSPHSMWKNCATLQALLAVERYVKLCGLLLRVVATPSLQAAFLFSTCVALLRVKHMSADVPALVVAVEEEEVHVLIDRVYDKLYVYVRE